MDIIRIDNISFGYTDDLVIKDLSLKVGQGDLVLLVGENGSGKSTLLKLILGEIKPKQGIIKILGKDINNMTSFREIGYVPQMNVVNKIAFPITCLELVVLNLYEDFGFFKIPNKKHLKKAKKILIEMGLEEYINVPFNELSGGLQQRVMISRAMINNPKLLVLDEPTSGVDQKSKEKFFELIKLLKNEYEISIVLVTHELELVNEFLDIDYVYRFKNGDIENVRI